MHHARTQYINHIFSHGKLRQQKIPDCIFIWFEWTVHGKSVNTVFIRCCASWGKFNAFVLQQQSGRHGEMLYGEWQATHAHTTSVCPIVSFGSRCVHFLRSCRWMRRRRRNEREQILRVCVCVCEFWACDGREQKCGTSGVWLLRTLRLTNEQIWRRNRI